MKFIIAKTEKNCYYCGGSIFPGEEAVVVRIFHRNLNRSIPQFFHPDKCYEEWNSASFNNRLAAWRNGLSQIKLKPTRGRPRKYRNQVKAHRVQSLLGYYRKKGDTERVLELESALNILLQH